MDRNLYKIVYQGDLVIFLFCVMWLNRLLNITEPNIVRLQASIGHLQLELGGVEKVAESFCPASSFNFVARLINCSISLIDDKMNKLALKILFQLLSKIS